MKSFLYAALALLAATQCAEAMDGMGSKRPPLTGGWKNAKPTQEMKKLLVTALTKGADNYAEGVTTQLCVKQLKYMETQVVSGTNYDFHVMACDVGSDSSLVGNCGQDNNCMPSSYKIRVYEQSWTDTLQVTDITVEGGPAKKLEVSNEEKNMIKVWLKKNNLNRFGDPKGTNYPGGTPLFNEATGTTIDRYKYIFARYPEHPWLPTAAPMMGMVHDVPLNLAAKESEAESKSIAQQRGQISEPSVVGLAVFGILTIAIGAVAFIKGRQTTTRRFTYDSVSRSEL